MKLFRSIRLEQGRSLNNQLKAERGYRNPSFLQKMVDHHEIDQYGTGFPQEIFDPKSLHQEVSICSANHASGGSAAVPTAASAYHCSH